MKPIEQLVIEARNRKLIEEFPFLQLRNIWTDKIADEPYSST